MRVRAQEVVLQCGPEEHLGGLLPWHCRVTQYVHLGPVRAVSEARLRAALVEYAALDVSTLHDLHAAWGHLVSEEEMARITGRRIKAAVEGEGRAKGARMAERDF